MKPMTLFLSALLIVAAGHWTITRYLIGFPAQSPARYAQTGPAFDIRAVLAGPMVSEGVIFGPTGAVTRRFVAEMTGTWDGDRGVMTENFRYDSGGTLDRRWSLTMGEGGSFTATAPDIIGTARGQQSGATVRLTYRLKLADEAGGHVLDVIDWLYLIEDGKILNRSEMRLFGVKVAELIATIRPAAK